ncbi:MAG: twin-arginine translocase TatA/TatE family subunit [Pirellulaceae bacterium]|nr:twin-arginine translocase TatA/TatE family subunit [Pirellulaceae bacterium]MDB4794001.1 twin-arginine translocase TatA/TatE family subunit [Pirellulaceae bacterium]MDG2467962.1 twin-arginine translocase TatA/TatE family subunit [Pirellulaceae bacterium]
MSFFAFIIPGGFEVWIILGIILLLFGSAQLPKLMFNIGKSKQALQKGLKEGINEGEAEMDALDKSED